MTSILLGLGLLGAESLFCPPGATELRGRGRAREPGPISLTVSTYSRASTCLICCFFPDGLADLLGMELLEL